MASPLRTWILKHPKASQRTFEILPGFVSWNMILFPIWGSLVAPLAVAVYLIAFFLYWLYRSLATAVRGIVAHRKIKQYEKRDWTAELAALPGSEGIRHVVVIPSYKEPVRILLRTLESLRAQTCGADRIIAVLAFEERAGADINDPREEAIRERFGGVFAELLFTRHPGNLPGEVIGKSSNMRWAALRVAELISSRPDWDPALITVSSTDADIRYHPAHFAALGQAFLSSPDRHRRIWQGAIMFYNNIYKIPALMRVFNRLLTVLYMGNLLRNEALVNFSTYHMSWKLLSEIGYWDADVIPEDSRIMFKAYFSTAGATTVEPLFLPIYADAAEDETFISTFVNTYEQVKRWAWGVSDDAYILKQAIIDQSIPASKKFYRVGKLFETHFLWPVNWFLLTLSIAVLSWLNPIFMLSPFGHDLPTITQLILFPTYFTLVAIVMVDLRSQPDFDSLPWWKKAISMVDLFVLLPFSGLFFSALPSLDSHTRLMFGRYMEYRTTEKV